MKKIMIIFAAMMLSLFGGKAMAQRTLPGMKSVEVKANMVDGFYTGSARNCGYSFGVYYSVFKATMPTNGSSGVSISKPISLTARKVVSLS